MTGDHFSDQAWTNFAIQRAVDAAAKRGSGAGRAGGAGKAGGVVEVEAGEYLMYDALHLRSGVRVVGGPGVVLKKVPSVSSWILDWLGYGHYEITVAEPEKFRPGMGVHVIDSQAMGFYTTVATIIEIEGERLFLDCMLHHDYSPGDGALAVSVFPLVEASGVTCASIEGICLDGNKDEETFELNGCRGGGVFIYQSREVVVRGVEVRNYRGDAISFQQNIDITVEDCHVHHNTGGGLHPGSGSVRYLLQNNWLHDNGGCGIFYCLRTTHSICRGNRIEGNGQAGISIGERDTDHLVTGNTIRGQGGPGVLFRPITRRGGDRVRLEGNTIGGNCRTSGGAEVEVAAGVRTLHFVGNVFEPGNKPAIWLGEGCEEIYIEGNQVSGWDLEPEDVTGRRELATFTAPAAFPTLGPLALPPDGARHLGVDNPGPCGLTLDKAIG
jgi:hypothetical protein